MEQVLLQTTEAPAATQNMVAGLEVQIMQQQQSALAVHLFMVDQGAAVGQRFPPQMLRKLVEPAALPSLTLLAAVALAALRRALPDRLGRLGQMDFAEPEVAAVAAELALAELVELVARRAVEVVEAQHR